MRAAGLVILLAWSLCAAASTPGEVLTAEEVETVLSQLPLTDIEGIWQLTDDGATVVIWRSETDHVSTVPTSYNMQLISAPDRGQRPGTLLGTLKPLAQPGTYDARLYSHTDKNGLPAKAKRYTMKLEDSAHLSFRKVNSGVRVSPILLSPRFLRRGIKVESDRGADLDGALKIYPRVPIKGAPRYL